MANVAACEHQVVHCVGQDALLEVQGLGDSVAARRKKFYVFFLEGSRGPVTCQDFVTGWILADLLGRLGTSVYNHPVMDREYPLASLCCTV